MKVKQILKTDNWEVELPCDMLVCGSLDSKWVTARIVKYEADHFMEEDNSAWHNAKPIPKKKTIPWDIDEFKQAFYDNVVFKDEESEFMIQDISNKGTLCTAKQSIGIYRAIENWTLLDGSKLEKEIDE